MWYFTMWYWDQCDNHCVSTKVLIHTPREIPSKSHIHSRLYMVTVVVMVTNGCLLWLTISTCWSTLINHNTVYVVSSQKILCKNVLNKNTSVMIWNCDCGTQQIDILQSFFYNKFTKDPYSLPSGGQSWVQSLNKFLSFFFVCVLSILIYIQSW